jgi:hypothetical protein
VLSGLLSTRFEDLEPTVGWVDRNMCLKHYDRLQQLGFEAAALHYGSHMLAQEAIGNFRRRFGREASMRRDQVHDE